MAIWRKGFRSESGLESYQEAVLLRQPPTPELLRLEIVRNSETNLQALRKRKYVIMTTIQAMNPEIVEILTNQLKTVAPVFETVRNARRPGAHVKRTATYGTPRLLVLLNILGACLLRDIE